MRQSGEKNALDYDFTSESLHKTFLWTICMYEPGRDKGSEKQLKICCDLKLRTKHLIQDHSMSFALVLELALGGEPTKIDYYMVTWVPTQQAQGPDIHLHTKTKTKFLKRFIITLINRLKRTTVNDSVPAYQFIMIPVYCTCFITVHCHCLQLSVSIDLRASTDTCITVKTEMTGCTTAIILRAPPKPHRCSATSL